MKKYLECGKIVSTHGIKGEVKVQVWADEPEFILDFKVLYFDKGATPVKVKSSRLNKNIALLKIDGVEGMDEANKLRGKILYANRDEIPMQEGEHFIQDLIGLWVIDADSGELYGEISDVSKTGANDVYHIKTELGKELLIPAIPQVIIDINISEQTMKIRPLEGLFDED